MFLHLDRGSRAAAAGAAGVDGSLSSELALVHTVVGGQGYALGGVVVAGAGVWLPRAVNTVGPNVHTHHDEEGEGACLTCPQRASVAPTPSSRALLMATELRRSFNGLVLLATLVAAPACVRGACQQPPASPATRLDSTPGAIRKHVRSGCAAWAPLVACERSVAASELW
jgi:hypothetical protein